MARLFFLLSGEHETLPAVEVEAILRTTKHAFDAIEKLDQLLRIEANPACVEAVKLRAAFTRVCALELFSCKAEASTIVETMKAISLCKVLGRDDSFAVRVKHVKSWSEEVQGISLERKLGNTMLKVATGSHVKLRNPDKTFIGVLTSGRFVFGLKMVDISPKQFIERRPRRKPFFHPSAMAAKLARCMVNLALAPASDLVFDPFCGTGTTLIEAALIGCRVLGLDVQRRMAKGTLRNLAHFNIEPEGIVVGDSRALPLSHVDCVVTDPPYGTSATTLRRSTKQIIEELLAALNGRIKRGRRVCIAAPKTLKISNMAARLGYKHVESHFVYVHRSLTREITVLERL